MGVRQGGHSLVTAMGHEDSCPFQPACVGARPGSGPAMKSPNKISFALRLGSFPFFLHLAKETNSWKILHSFHPTEGSSDLPFGGTQGLPC